MGLLGDLSARIRIDTSDLKRAQGEASGFGNTLRGFLGAEAIIEAGKAVVDFGKDAFNAFNQAQSAQLKLQDAFARSPQLIGANLAQFEQLAQAQSDHTRFSKIDTESAEAQLAQFHLTGQQLKDLIPLTEDYAARTGTDAASAANTLGSALLGKGRALKQVGINFKDLHDPTKNYNELMQDLRQQVSGFANKDANTAQGKLDILKHKFEDVQVAVGQGLSVAISKLADLAVTYLLPALDKVGGFLQQNVFPGVQAVGNALSGPASKSLQGFAQMVGNEFAIAGKFAGDFARVFEQEWPKIEPPLKDLVDAIGSGMKQVFDVINTKVMPLIRKFEPYVVMAFRAILKEVEKVLPTVVQIVKASFTLIAAVISKAVDVITWIWDHFGTQIVAVIKYAWQLVSDVVETALNFIRDIIQTVTDLIQGKWGKVWDDIRKLVSDAWNAITRIMGDALGGILKFFVDLPGKIVGALLSVAGAIGGAGKSIIGWIAGGIATVVTKLWDFVADLPKNILGALAGIAKSITDLGGKIIGWIVDGIKNAAGNVAGAVKNAVGDAVGGVGGFIGNLNPFGGGKAAGGPVYANKTYLVGEKGPELFTPGASGNITPNSGMGQNINVYVTNSPASAYDIGKELGWRLRTA